MKLKPDYQSITRFLELWPEVLSDLGSGSRLAQANVRSALCAHPLSPLFPARKLRNGRVPSGSDDIPPKLSKCAIGPVSHALRALVLRTSRDT